jgi:hypothetical protein
MTFPKKQHWVPRFYLKEFAIPESKNSKVPQLWAFSKNHSDRKEPSQVSIFDTACSRYMYSPLDDKGKRDFYMEKRFEELEDLVAKIWQKVCYEYIDISDSVRKVMSLFLATTILRNKKSSDQHNSIYRNMLKQIDGLPKDKLGRPCIDKVIFKGKEYEFDCSDWFEFKNASEEDLKRSFVETIKEGTCEFTNILLKKNWSFLVFSKPILATSDKPVITVNFNKDKFGIGTEGTIIYFPLTPCRVLEIGGPREDNKYFGLDEQWGHCINYLLWTDGGRFMYAHRNTDEVLFEICKFIDRQKNEISGG